MEEKLVKILNEMAEYLSISQMKKLQEVLLKNMHESKEETGLTIKNPKLAGIYHWMTDDIRNVGYLYKATEFEGELISSEEGKVYWISGEEFLKKPLTPGMLQVWQMMHDANANECLQTLTADGDILSKIQ